MSWIVKSLVLLTAVGFLHIAVMAFAARAVGITIRKVSFGAGPTLWESGIFRLGWFPFSGSVSLKDSREEILSDSMLADTFDHAPAWKQLVMPVAGLGTLLSLSFLVLGPPGIEAFVNGFRQIIFGAFSPFVEAHSYLQAGQAYAESHSLLEYAALLGAKFVVMNSLPIAGLNGYQILVTPMRFGKVSAPWENHLSQWSFVTSLLLFCAWALAIGHYIDFGKG